MSMSMAKLNMVPINSYKILSMSGYQNLNDIKEFLKHYEEASKEVYCENEELKSEINELNMRLDEYKKLYTKECQAKECLQNALKQNQLEIVNLQKMAEKKDDVLSKMKDEFEFFMDEVCDENLRLKDIIQSTENDLLKFNKQKEENEKCKNYIEQLENEVMDSLKKMFTMQNALDEHEACVNKKDSEIQKREQKLMICNYKLNNANEEIVSLTEEITNLKLGVSRAEKEALDYCSKIKDHAQTAAALEDQLKENQVHLKQLQDIIGKDKIIKEDLQSCLTDYEACFKEQEEVLCKERLQREALEQELAAMKHKCILSDQRLKKCCEELRKTTDEYKIYREQINHLKKHVEQNKGISDYNNPNKRKFPFSKM